MHVYHAQIYLNSMDDFVMGEKVWKTTSEQEDPAPAKHQKILQRVFCFGERLSADNPNGGGETP